MSARASEGWDALYRRGEVERMPWYHADLDADVAAALARRGLTDGRVLDLGCGPGTQAVHLGRRGFAVTASDLSAAAVAHTEHLARQQGVAVLGVVDDILATSLRGPFALILDRGCLHVLPPRHRHRYVDAVRGLLAQGGVLLLKCFSELQPGHDGPFRLSPDELRATFEGALEVVALRRSVYQGTFARPPQALFAELEHPAAR